MKICTLCRIEKPLDNFSLHKASKDNFHFWCKPCLKKKKAEYFQKNKEKDMARMSAWAKSNPEKSAAIKRKNYQNKKDIYCQQAKDRREKDPQANRIRCAEYRKRNLEKAREACRVRQKNNREKVNTYHRVYRKTRIGRDALYSLRIACRHRILKALKAKGFQKNSKTTALLGCTIQELKLHIESQFQHGMTWENRGFAGWHIDHRVPLASAGTEAELLALCHFSNLQPMWAEENFAKGAKMPHELEHML